LVVVQGNLYVNTQIGQVNFVNRSTVASKGLNAHSSLGMAKLMLANDSGNCQRYLPEN
jgi:hypothetical protein